MPLSTQGQLPAYTAPGAEAVSIVGGSGTTTVPTGADLNVTAGAGNGVAPFGDGGQLLLEGGPGAAAGGAIGGDVSIGSGDGDPAPGSGSSPGIVRITTGHGDTASFISIAPGGIETGTGSNVEIESGVSGTGVNGDITMDVDTGANGPGNVKIRGPFRPSTPAFAFQTDASIYAGVGAPANGDGANGDMYFRSDGGAGTTIYQKRAGAWVGIV